MFCKKVKKFHQYRNWIIYAYRRVINKPSIVNSAMWESSLLLLLLCLQLYLATSSFLFILIFCVYWNFIDDEGVAFIQCILKINSHAFADYCIAWKMRQLQPLQETRLLSKWIERRRKKSHKEKLNISHSF